MDDDLKSLERFFPLKQKEDIYPHISDANLQMELSDRMKITAEPTKALNFPPQYLTSKQLEAYDSEYESIKDLHAQLVESYHDLINETTQTKEN